MVSYQANQPLESVHSSQLIWNVDQLQCLFASGCSALLLNETSFMLKKPSCLKNSFDKQSSLVMHSTVIICSEKKKHGFLQACQLNSDPLKLDNHYYLVCHSHPTHNILWKFQNVGSIAIIHDQVSFLLNFNRCIQLAQILQLLPFRIIYSRVNQLLSQSLFVSEQRLVNPLLFLHHPKLLLPIVCFS